MEQMCRNAIECILNHWTALRLAVEHSMGGPQSKQNAFYIIEYLTAYLCNEASVEVEDIEDVLEDIMDKDFNTVCEDNSIKEVAFLINKMVHLIKEGKFSQVEMELNNLPPVANWLDNSFNIAAQSVDTSSEEDEVNPNAPSTSEKQEQMVVDEEMEDESGWRTVRNRRKN